MNKLLNIALTILIVTQLMSCEQFLELKPDAKLKVVTTLNDLDAVMNNTSVMNYYTMGIGEASADNYYVDYNVWKSLDQGEREMYIWGNEIFYQSSSNPWMDYYRVVYYANFVLSNLESMPNLEASQNSLYRNLKGRALFFRAYSFFKLVTLFSKTYDLNTANSDLGIPLRLSDDFNQPTTRASVHTCYHQICEDLIAAKDLLNDRSTNQHEPSRHAALLLLSWTSLIMQDFNMAARYGQDALSIDDRLIDYTKYNGSNSFPFEMNNSEVAFIVGGVNNLIGYWYSKIDLNLYTSYSSHDFRKSLFFGTNTDGTIYFRGSYLGANGLFMGLATTDAYFNVAESLIRLGQVSEGLHYLNEVLKMRYLNANIPTLQGIDIKSALQLTLSERRKEFIMRDSRWIDIKRLNKFEDSQIVLKRFLNGTEYDLGIDDNKYALPIPEEIIQITGIPQNPR